MFVQSSDHSLVGRPFLLLLRWPSPSPPSGPASTISSKSSVHSFFFSMLPRKEIFVRSRRPRFFLPSYFLPPTTSGQDSQTFQEFPDHRNLAHISSKFSVLNASLIDIKMLAGNPGVLLSLWAFFRPLDPFARPSFPCLFLSFLPDCMLLFYSFLLFRASRRDISSLRRAFRINLSLFPKFYHFT